jgi:pimeloyl-ACP methyl ester carboxylesterase
MSMRVRRHRPLPRPRLGPELAKRGQGAVQATLQIDGIDVFVEGEGSETIVMLHGWPDTYRLWDAQVQALKAKYRCVRFTLPGFDIDRPRRAWTLAEMVQMLKKVIEQTGRGAKVVLMVHDWGCLFGYQLLMRYPSLVSRIIGVDIGDVGSPQHRKALRARDMAMIFGYQVWLAIAWRIGGGVGDRMTKYMARKLRCPADARYIGAQMNYPYYIQWTGRHGSYRDTLTIDPPCPMLFIYGTRKLFLFHSQAWADALAARPGNQVVALRTGHWVMNNDAAQFNRAVLAWLAG